MPRPISHPPLAARRPPPAAAPPRHRIVKSKIRPAPGTPRHQSPGPGGQARNQKKGADRGEIGPGNLHLPQTTTLDLTGQVLEALDEEDGPPLAYQRRPLPGGKARPAAVRGDVTCPGTGGGGPHDAGLRRDLDPVTGPVRPPTRADQAWAHLAAELTPARSLARIDTVTARAVTTITVVGVLLTGLGALAAGLPTQHTSQPGDLAAATVITAARRSPRADRPGPDHHPPPQPRQPDRGQGLVPAPVRHPRLPHPGRHRLAAARRAAGRRHRGHRPDRQPRHHAHPRPSPRPSRPPAPPGRQHRAGHRHRAPSAGSPPGRPPPSSLTTARHARGARSRRRHRRTRRHRHRHPHRTRLTVGQPVTITARDPHQACQATLPTSRPARPHLPPPLSSHLRPNPVPARPAAPSGAAVLAAARARQAPSRGPRC